ncbi:putative damage-induced DNA-directed DNA polymerase [Frankia alni ACN14a]|uniref:DNA-directed DNA polymerase n=1 Tax=Frankia alni (strain DSM 45986 / CECT 9034 / ACN14a) TaxID=326424 RepID=Q0RNQ5_FRAAA|nr:putative damage-induced DNA-directed DNA polymerase [Frankia alni ACN14a]
MLSATYEARAYGVRSAMPMARARRLCPTAAVVAPDHAAYRAASVAIMKIFRDVTPLVAPLSVDEAFLDVAGARALFGSAPRIAADIRRRVAAEQDLTCSVGVAPSMFVAKIASTRCKPDGLAVIAPDAVLAFLHPLPTGALWGVGPRAEAALTRLGLHTIGDIADTPVDTLRRALGDAVGTHLHRLSWGIDERRVDPATTEVTVGAERTFATDITEPAALARELLRLSGRVAGQLRLRHRRARTISVKVRYGDFRTVTRARTLRDGTDVSQAIYATATDLVTDLGLLGAGRAAAAEVMAVRLLGVRAGNLVDAGGASKQLRLGERPDGWAELDRVADRARERFGADAVGPAALLDHPEGPPPAPPPGPP